MIAIPFSGVIISIQPRIRLLRSFDESSHSYLGYAISINGQVDGQVNGEERVFSVGIGKAAQEKHQFKVGDTISGCGFPVVNQKLEPVEYYKVSKLKKRELETDLIDENSKAKQSAPPPWRSIPPELEIYRERGHRRLSVRTYTTACYNCIWGCRIIREVYLSEKTLIKLHR